MVKYLAGVASANLLPRRATFARAARGPALAGQLRYRLAACVRIKNEARFLPELLAHYHLLGFEHFWLYDNNSTDRPQEILAPFLERGLLTIVPWPTVPAAPSCYRHFFEHFDTQAQWVAFIDADEFIVERSTGALEATLQRLDARCAFGINCRYLGSSAHLSIPDGLVLEQFHRCNPILGDHVKVMLQPTQALAYFNTHNFIYRHWRCARDIRGRAIFGTYATAEPESQVELHHYVYRSREDYLAKLGLGFADSDGYKNRARRIERAESEFFEHNSADVSWVGRKYGPGVRGLLRQLGYAERFWRSPGAATPGAATPGAAAAAPAGI
jgi:hypothetical protein